ncbi:hypothetical protein IV203_009937 [Nitzschia inconspicua]|uniref:Uncharacterized protein n=1 Tax=Nitzschia inconspicua TaxID=303405 RepID=A0A9K3PJZ9_9STRA|nr:hypothetical protein IV203_009937 [Nitzschia inconspicua]
MSNGNTNNAVLEEAGVTSVDIDEMNSIVGKVPAEKLDHSPMPSTMSKPGHLHRFITRSGYGLNSRRMRTLPPNFETQLFLGTKNKTFWGLADINHIVTLEKDDENNARK